MPLKPKAHRSSKAWFKHLPYFQLADTNVSRHTDAVIAVLPTLWLCLGAFQSVLTTESVKTQLATTKLATMLFFIRCLCRGAAQLHYFTTTDLIWFDTGLPYWVWVYATVSSRDCIVPLPPHQYSIQWLWSVCCYTLFICIILGVQIVNCTLAYFFWVLHTQAIKYLV